MKDGGGYAEESSDECEDDPDERRAEKSIQADGLSERTEGGPIFKDEDVEEHAGSSDQSRWSRDDGFWSRRGS